MTQDRKGSKKIEILAPAGSYGSFMAAVNRQGRMQCMQAALVLVQGLLQNNFHRRSSSFLPLIMHIFMAESSI